MAYTSVMSDPSVDGPSFKFGKAQDGVAAYYDTVPNLSATTSAWHLAEWHTTSTLNPAQMVLQDSAERDILLGTPSYSWSTGNGNIRFSVYGKPGAFSYRLSDYNGMLTSDGAQNILLEAPVAGTAPTFDHPITFAADEAITAVVRGGAGQQVGNNFTVVFNLPGSVGYDPNLKTISAFLQVPLADSRGSPGAYASYGTNPIYNVTGVASMSFAPSTVMSRVEIDLNAALNRFLEDYKQTTGVPAEVTQLQRWSLTSTYLGSETTDGGGLSLDLANVSVMTDKDIDYQVGSKPVVSITPEPQSTASEGAVISLMNGTTGLQSNVSMDASATDPSFIHWKYLYSGSDSMAMSVSTPNVFIRGGTGADAIAVSSGQNVLDGGTGSNFLTGGSGQDTFFTDARGDAVVWNTIQNFHAGDAATLWGFDPSRSSFAWDANLAGASGSQGATLRANIVGGHGRSGDGIDASITFAGLSVADAKSLHFATGTALAGSYLYITR